MLRASILAVATAVSLVPGLSMAKNTAIVIGIGQYAHLKPEQQLKAPVSDAFAIQDFLISEGWFAKDEIVMLLNKTATGDRIAAEIKKAAEMSDPGDKVLIYFSGHGGRRPDTNGDEADGYDELLLAHDFKGRLASASGDGANGMLLDDWMGEALKDLDGRDVTIILDSCHSATSTRTSSESTFDGPIARGLLIQSARGAQRDAVTTAQEASFVEIRQTTHSVWAASAPEQYAWEQGGKGIFTDFFLSGLRDRNADSNRNGIITSAELWDYTQKRTAAWCKDSKKCRELNKGFTPHFEGPADQVVLNYLKTAQSSETAASDENPTSSATEQPTNQVTSVDDSAQTPVLTEGLPVPTNDGENTQQSSEQLSLADLLGSSNTADLQLDIVNGSDLTIGQMVQFELSTRRSGTLVLFDVNPDGQLLKLSPSVISRANIEKVTPDQTIYVPEGLSANGKPIAIEVTEPTGTGQLVALLIEDDSLDIRTFLGTNLQGEPIPNARGYLANLAERLRRIQANRGINRPLDWSTTYLTYNIKP
ncbi:MAG: caspase family protein [Hyphomicrobiales bacterium]